MKKLILLLCLIIGIGMIPAGAVHADTVGLGTWYEIVFNSNPLSFATGESGNPNPPWTYNESFSTRVTVTDVFLEGDMFTVYDNSVVIGTTSSVSNTSNSSGISDPDAALGNSLLSHGYFDLAPGSHSLTIEIIQTALIPAHAYFRVDPVPLPPTVYLLGSSLVGLMGFRLRRKKQA